MESKFRKIDRFVRQKVNGGGNEVAAFGDAFDCYVVFHRVFEIYVQIFPRQRAERYVRFAFDQGEEQRRFATVVKSDIYRAVCKFSARYA